MNSFEYLDMLRQQEEGRHITYSDLTAFLKKKARENNIPVDGHFELTPLCNFDCKMCYVHLTKDQLHETEILSVDQWKSLMHQAWQAGMYHCTLTGGECIAYPGFKELYLFLQDLGCEISVLTNGYLLDESWIRFFLDHRPASIQITLYGCNDDAYERVTGKRAFETVVNNMRNLVKAGLPLCITLTPNSYLGDDALETLKIAYGLTNKVAINPILSTPREETGRTGIGEEADIDLYVRLYRLKAELEGRQPGGLFEGKLPEAGGPYHECKAYGIRCAAGRAHFAIDWKGTMTMCSSLDSVQSYPLEEGFRNAWKKLNQAAREWPHVPECEGCAYQSVCDVCAAYEHQFAEPGKQPNAICERTKYYVRNGVWNKPACE